MIPADYAEASYFDGFHFYHIAVWQDRQRVERLRERSARLVRIAREGR